MFRRHLPSLDQWIATLGPKNFVARVEAQIEIVYRIYLYNSLCYNNSPSSGLDVKNGAFWMVYDNIYNDIKQWSDYTITCSHPVGSFWVGSNAVISLINSYPTGVSADNLANSLDPDQARRFVGPDLDPNCLTLWWYSGNTFWKKVNFEEKDPQTTKNITKILTVGKEFKCWLHLKFVIYTDTRGWIRFFTSYYSKGNYAIRICMFNTARVAVEHVCASSKMVLASKLVLASIMVLTSLYIGPHWHLLWCAKQTLKWPWALNVNICKPNLLFQLKRFPPQK